MRLQQAGGSAGVWRIDWRRKDGKLYDAIVPSSHQAGQATESNGATHTRRETMVYAKSCHTVTATVSNTVSEQLGEAQPNRW